MRKINSIDYGYKIVFSIALSLMILPALLCLPLMLIKAEWLSLLIKISIGIGLAILLLFILLLIIELHQDKRIDRYYLTHRNRKLQIADSVFECQSCGNRSLKSDDKQCGTCGCRFEE